jgi:hypothetical protein
MRLWIAAILTIWSMLLGCNGSLKEASAEFDAAKLRVLLKAIQPLVQKGFDEAQIGQIEGSFQALAVNETRRFDFPILYNGVETELRVQIRKEDVDVVEIHFFSVPALAEQIQRTIRATPLDSN